MKRIRDKSVLIIDDDAGMLRALDKVLTGEGAIVTRAIWAGDAVEILTAHQKEFDLVITDLRMPFVTGLTVVYAVHRIYPNLPVIVLTAFGGPDVKAECFRQGASAFLEKPLDTTELMTAVQQVLAASEKQSPSGGGLSKNNFTNEYVDTETNRLSARRPTPDRRDREYGDGAGPANRRKEQVHEYRAR